MFHRVPHSLPLLCLLATLSFGCDTVIEPAECDGGDCLDAAGDDGGGSCPAGREGCVCRAAGSPCAPGLECVEGVCASCPDGDEGCACRTTGEACESGLACEDRSCVSCEPGTEGCDCDAGGCGAGLSCESSRCRAPSSCDALRDAGECPAGRACTLVGGVPTCLDTCETGFRLEAGACVMCPESGCDEETCADLDCTARNRTCAEGSAGPSCGGCITGFREDETFSCVDERLCDGALCADGEIPVHGAATCECVPEPCPTGQARTVAGVCVTCGIVCGGVEGESGALHPLTAGLACMCETIDGYFVPPGEDGRARRCDDDGDGWVGTTALAAQRSPDLAVSSNARCDVARAAEVGLSNEYGQTLSLRPCADGLIADRGSLGPGACADFGGLEPIVLVEPDRNDRQAVLAAEVSGPTAAAPAYGARAFRANELNALTRACVTEHADYDADGTPDLQQSQAAPSAAVDNRARLAALSFFTELHTASFTADPLGGDGTLTIAEVSRCAAGFPLDYGTLDGGSDYWEGCHRQRDVRFGLPSAPPGLDFAAYTCEATSGACEMPPPATGRARTECPIGAAGECHPTAPFHDVCEPGLDWGPVFRGMHHHSQFRCTLVDDGSSASHAVPHAAISASGHLAFSRCSLGAAGISCLPSSATGVGWTALRYAAGVSVDVAPDEPSPLPSVRGCVDEAATEFEGTPWSASLCPSPTDPAITLNDDFGRLDCPCSASETVCGDGADDDCDGLMDCADPDCDEQACGGGLLCGLGSCACTASETTCTDMRDDDCDGLRDCEDPDCDGAICGPNGLTCFDESACRCPSASELCNGVDDDCDGLDDDSCPASLVLGDPTTTTPRRGTNSGSAVNRACPAGSVLVGLDVRSGTLVDQLTPYCAPLEMVVDASLEPEFGYSMEFGVLTALPTVDTTSSGATLHTLRCPAGQMAFAIQGTTNSRLNSIGLACQPHGFERSAGGGWQAVRQGSPSITRIAGNIGAGTVYTDLCPEGQVVTELLMTANTADIFSIRARCQTILPQLR